MYNDSLHIAVEKRAHTILAKDSYIYLCIIIIKYHKHKILSGCYYHIVEKLNYNAGACPIYIYSIIMIELYLIIMIEL